jgi:ribosomal protein L14E/L6E/L27E
MTRGQVVYSKCGRDKGIAFVVLSVEGNYVYLADGSTRRLIKPKKKKIMHVQPTKTVLDLQAAGARGLQDADLRKWLKEIC